MEIPIEICREVRYVHGCFGLGCRHGAPFQDVCQTHLRQRSTQDFCQSIVIANRLEFPLIRKGIEDSGSPGECSRLTVTLKCDFLALT
jgi:hypothetical protein